MCVVGQDLLWSYYTGFSEAGQPWGQTVVS